MPPGEPTTPSWMVIKMISLLQKIMPRVSWLIRWSWSSTNMNQLDIISLTIGCIICRNGTLLKRLLRSRITSAVSCLAPPITVNVDVCFSLSSLQGVYWLRQVTAEWLMSMGFLHLDCCPVFSTLTARSLIILCICVRTDLRVCLWKVWITSVFFITASHQFSSFFFVCLLGWWLVFLVVFCKWVIGNR